MQSRLNGTVTDAQVLLGYLDPDYYLGRRMVLDRAAAQQVIQSKIADGVDEEDGY